MFDEVSIGRRDQLVDHRCINRFASLLYPRYRHDLSRKRYGGITTAQKLLQNLSSQREINEKETGLWCVSS